ncbi:hypothetical protein PMG11_00754 [Penicillium brasilianum]|uniref:PHD-type domain-containing protein n=1 Tax=Penicillium brasilianum TaxID=104259 RepID=A0A0F7TCN5_PENBI|nr:hypothetical protein PMG11_00754 [Penicillium brasilianum]
MKPNTAAKAVTSADLASSSVTKREVLQDQPLSGLPAAQISMKKPAGHDTWTSRSGRVIKPPTAFVPPPAPIASGKRKGGSRKKEANVTCKHCNRGHSPSNNAIVFCDGCNDTWHQKCHDPPIDKQVILVKDMEWFCRKCRPPRRPPPAKAKPAKVKKAGRTVHPRLQAGPRLEVGGNQFTADERRAYFSCLSHAQLVELLVNISSKNPSVPMLPANIKDLPASQFVFKPKGNDGLQSDTGDAPEASSNKRTRAEQDPSDADLTTNPRKRPRTTSAAAIAPIKNPSPQPDAEPSTRSPASTTATPDLVPPSAPIQSKIDPNTTISQRPQGDRPSVVSRNTTVEDSDTPTSDDESFDTVEDHRMYPRTGRGFSPSRDPEDLKILDENPDSKTFSHSMHGPAKKAQEMGVPPRVWES